MLVYECLDIHRLMLGTGMAGQALRWLEGRLLRSCDALAISSPGFAAQYFQPRYARLPRLVLIENKLLQAEAPHAVPMKCTDGAPWRIGWFGIIRCARSLEVSGRASCAPCPVWWKWTYAAEPRGMCCPALMPSSPPRQACRSTASMTARGDLPSIYGCVHFTWTLDFYEAGGNSDWLLPNRLYEGGVHGPVALAGRGQSNGALAGSARSGRPSCTNRSPTCCAGFFLALTGAAYAEYFAAMRKIPLNSLVYDEEACNFKMRELIGRRS